jgi:protein gp37
MSTGIEWTDETWNPVVGCNKVSQGCKFCYAKTLHDMRHAAHLNGKTVHPQYAVPFETVQRMSERLTKPLKWKKPKRIFVNSVSDLFHDDVPDEFIESVFGVMAVAKHHTFQILTKRPERMLKWFTTPAGLEDRYEAVLREGERLAGIVWDSRGPHYEKYMRATPKQVANRREYPGWPLPNVWLGVSVENQEAANERIPLLVETPAAVRWLSCEPLLGAIDFYEAGSRGGEDGDPFAFSALTGTDGTEPSIPGIDWVVVGGESGAKSQNVRPMHPEWARWLRDQCVAAGVPFLFKQWGDWRPVFDRDVKEKGQCLNLIGCRVVRVGKKRAGRELDGRTWDEYPAVRP